MQAFGIIRMLFLSQMLPGYGRQSCMRHMMPNTAATLAKKRHFLSLNVTFGGQACVVTQPRIYNVVAHVNGSRGST